jgi:hypothetical protein
MVAQFLRNAIVGACDSGCLPRIPRTFRDLAPMQLFRFLTSRREKCRRQIPKNTVSDFGAKQCLNVLSLCWSNAALR